MKLVKWPAAVTAALLMMILRTVCVWGAVPPGCLDGIKDGFVWGWAWDAARPQVPVPVRIEIRDAADNAVAAAMEVTADRYRAGLDAFGGGNHAFCAELPSGLSDESTYIIEAFTDLGPLQGRVIRPGNIPSVSETGKGSEAAGISVSRNTAENASGPGTVGPGTVDPGTFAPDTFDPGTFAPDTFDPDTIGPGIPADADTAGSPKQSDTAETVAAFGKAEISQTAINAGTVSEPYSAAENTNAAGVTGSDALTAGEPEASGAAEAAAAPANTLSLVPLGTFSVTGYCSCRSCSGRWGRVTASGALATAGHTIAVDPRVIPYGTRLMIDGVIYTAEDTGGGVKGNHIDIYYDSHAEAAGFGFQYKPVFLVR